MNGPIPIRRRQKKAAPSMEDLDLHTDRWAGAQFAQMWSRTLRYDIRRKVFPWWDGRRWRVSQPAELESLAKQTVQHWLADVVLEDDPRRRSELLSWARRMCSMARLRAMIELAASEQILWTPSEKFDTHPDLFNCANGTIDLRTGQLRAHDPVDFITKVSPVPYDPNAKAPRFIQFVDEVFDNRVDLIQFAQRAAGYSLTGHTREHCFLLLHGRGRNGKGALVRALSNVAGEYAVTAAIETFTTRRTNAAQASPDLAALAGARMVTTGEADAGARLAEGLVKAFTGDDAITCRNLNEDLFTFRPQFTMWMHVNHKPVIRGVDAGIWSRVRFMPFDVSFEGREDKQLEERLAAEAPGILAWCVRGAVEWYRSGLGMAEAVTTATANYRDESDTLAPFLEAKCEIDSKGTITRKRVGQLYAGWCESQSEEPMKAATLYRMLQDRAGIGPFKSDGERGFRGLKEKEKTT